MKIALIENLCPPAFLFLIFIATQVALDLSLGMYYTAMLKVAAGAVQVYLLNSFCKVDLGVVSWAVIAVPFLITALGASIALGLQLDHHMSMMMQEHFTPDGKHKKKPKKKAKKDKHPPAEEEKAAMNGEKDIPAPPPAPPS